MLENDSLMPIGISHLLQIEQFWSLLFYKTKKVVYIIDLEIPVNSILQSGHI